MKDKSWLIAEDRNNGFNIFSKNKDLLVSINGSEIKYHSKSEYKVEVLYVGCDPRVKTFKTREEAVRFANELTEGNK